MKIFLYRNIEISVAIVPVILPIILTIGSVLMIKEKKGKFQFIEFILFIVLFYRRAGSNQFVSQLTLVHRVYLYFN